MVVVIWKCSIIWLDHCERTQQRPPPSAQSGGQTDRFKISIIIITVFIKEPYTLEKVVFDCVYRAAQRDRDTFVGDSRRQRGEKEGGAPSYIKLMSVWVSLEGPAKIPLMLLKWRNGCKFNRQEAATKLYSHPRTFFMLHLNPQS